MKNILKAAVIFLSIFLCNAASAGTLSMVADLNTLLTESDSDLQYLIVIGTDIYFRADDWTHGDEL